LYSTACIEIGDHQVVVEKLDRTQSDRRLFGSQVAVADDLASDPEL
jgi:hypothetical protein